MIDLMLEACDYSTAVSDDFAVSDHTLLFQNAPVESVGAQLGTDAKMLARALSVVEENTDIRIDESAIPKVPVLGITGTGGAGKSSLTDEIVRRFLQAFPALTMAVLSVDPSKRRTGGALLGDRIRMNAIATSDPQSSQRVFMRSFATRAANTATSAALLRAIDICKIAGFDLVIVETAGIGQSDSAITDLVDVSMYVMTPEYGAQTQLEKIDMLDLADLVVLNKFEKRGAEDALRDIRKQVRRNLGRWDAKDEELPVYATIASQFNDRGTNHLFHSLVDAINRKTGTDWQTTLGTKAELPDKAAIIPPERTRYLADISDAVQNYKKWAEEQSVYARKWHQLLGAKETLIEASTRRELRISGPGGVVEIGRQEVQQDVCLLYTSPSPRD